MGSLLPSLTPRHSRLTPEGSEATAYASLLPFDLPPLERFENVADLHIRKVRDHDSALEALGHLADIVLEMLERLDLAREDNVAATADADVGVAGDLAVGDVTAGDHDAAGRLEPLAHLGLTQRDLLEDRGEQPLHRALDRLGQLVDDVVGANVDMLAFGGGLGRLVRPDVESDHDG